MRLMKNSCNNLRIKPIDETNRYQCFDHCFCFCFCFCVCSSIMVWFNCYWQQWNGPFWALTQKSQLYKQHVITLNVTLLLIKRNFCVHFIYFLRKIVIILGVPILYNAPNIDVNEFRQPSLSKNYRRSIQFGKKSADTSLCQFARRWGRNCGVRHLMQSYFITLNDDLTFQFFTL